MAALKFETFPPAGATESSASQETSKLLAQAYRDGHSKGFAQGSEESAREHADAQEQLTAQFIEALKDREIDHSATQRSVIASLFPLLDAIVTTLSPNLAEVGFLDLVRTSLSVALDSRPSIKPSLKCAPELVETVEKAFADWKGEFEIVVDNRLTPMEAQVHWEDGFDHIDLDSTLAEMKQSISRYLGAIEDINDEVLENVG